MAEMCHHAHLYQGVVFSHTPLVSPGAVPITPIRNHQSWSSLSLEASSRQVQTGGVEGGTRWPHIPSWHLGY